MYEKYAPIIDDQQQFGVVCRGKFTIPRTHTDKFRSGKIFAEMLQSTLVNRRQN
jgi:hypothetical protein